jgi:predicted Zn-dependent peptidase
LKFQHITLENGLDIVAEVNPDAYSLAVAYFVKTGARDESPELAGVSHFLEHMMFKGTPRRSAEDVNRELDELGAQSNAYTSEEQTVYYAIVLPELQRPVVDLLTDIMRPSLRQDDFDTEKQVILEEILKYEDQPPFGGHEMSMLAFYGDHPLGKSVLGTTQSVGGLTREQMLKYFEHRYSPGNLTLVATGNVDFEALVDQARQLCSDWKPFPHEREILPAQPRSNFQLITKSTSAQQYLIQLMEGPSANSPDRYAARLLAGILGDDSGSRYYWELVDPGLAEFASLETYEFQGTGLFMNYACCAPEAAPQVLETMETELARAIREGVTPRELELVKNKICSHTVLRSERPSGRLFSVGSNWVQRGTFRSVADSVRAYQDVTLDEIHAVLQRYRFDLVSTTTVGPLTSFVGR